MTSTFDLGSLTLGDVAEVVRIEGADPLAQRLEACGFWPGTAVTAVRRAPLGGPIEFQLRGFRLALRPSEAARVQVRTAGGDAS